MVGQDVLSSHRSQSRHRKARPSSTGGLKQLSDRTPLRTKLIAAVLALVILALAAISVTSVVVLRSYLYTQRDGPLQHEFTEVSKRIASFPAGELSFGVDYPYNLGSGMILAFQIPGSQITSPSLGTPPPGMTNSSHPTQSVPELPASSNWAPSDTPILTTQPARSGGNTWRVMAQAVMITSSATNTEQPAIMVVAVDLGPVGAEIQRLIIVELTVGTAIVVVLAIVGVGVVRANLRPLDDIEMTAGEIAKGHLGHRVPERDPRTEIGSLGRSLNAMLTQIETAFHAQQESERAAHQSEERMRRFIADASHELRTPLTTIRGFAAHYRQRGGAAKLQLDPPPSITSARTYPGSSLPATASAWEGGRSEGLSLEDLDHLIGRIESESTRMGLLVEDLLTLARLDQQRPLSKAPVDLLTLAADAVQDARIVKPGRPIDLVVAPGTAFLVEGDEPRLRQVLGNLVNNAITHTPDGTPVRVRIACGAMPAGGGRTAPAVVLDVEDNGPGMTAEQAQRVFERFYRADAARNRASGGTGLGLAIVAGLVAAHGGTVSVRTAPGAGADFQVKLPLAPDAQGLDDADEDLGG